MYSHPSEKLVKKDTLIQRVTQDNGSFEFTKETQGLSNQLRMMMMIEEEEDKEPFTNRKSSIKIRRQTGELIN